MCPPGHAVLPQGDSEQEPTPAVLERWLEKANWLALALEYTSSGNSTKWRTSSVERLADLADDIDPDWRDNSLANGSIEHGCDPYGWDQRADAGIRDLANTVGGLLHRWQVFPEPTAPAGKSVRHRRLRHGKVEVTSDDYRDLREAVQQIRDAMRHPSVLDFRTLAGGLESVQKADCAQIHLFDLVTYSYARQHTGVLEEFEFEDGLAPSDGLLLWFHEPTGRWLEDRERESGFDDRKVIRTRREMSPPDVAALLRRHGRPLPATLEEQLAESAASPGRAAVEETPVANDQAEPQPDPRADRARAKKKPPGRKPKTETNDAIVKCWKEVRSFPRVLERLKGQFPDLTQDSVEGAVYRYRDSLIIEYWTQGKDEQQIVRLLKPMFPKITIKLVKSKIAESKVAQ